ncbi:MAG: hypothetical protein GC178_17655 [Flavobacteriales bacterium]|nr:hypothetical protein [Flavobacteriales bacterium]
MKTLLFYYRTLLTMMMAAGMTLMNLDVVGQSSTVETSGCTTSPTITSGNCSFSQGDGSDVDADNAAAFGGSSASGTGSFAAAGSDASGAAAAAMAGGDAGGDHSFAACGSSRADGESACALSGGVAEGVSSVAVGESSYVEGDYTIGVGFGVATGSSNTNNFIFGTSLRSPVFTNDIDNSMMFGINSDVPTMFIEDSYGTENVGGTWGRVGIGTTDPDGLLHLKDESGDDTYMVIEKADADEGGIVWHNGAQTEGTVNASLLFDANEDIKVRNAVSDRDIIFNINDGGTDTEVMRVDGSTSRVSIGGIANPNAKFHIKDEVSGAEVLTQYTVGDAAGDWLQIRNASTGMEFIPEVFGNAANHSKQALRLTAESDDDTGTEPMMTFTVRWDDGLDIVPVEDRPLFEWQNDSERVMRMDANGNLGIGTTSPSGKLEVAGTTFINTLPPNGSGNRVGIGTGNQLTDWDASSMYFKENIEDLEFDKQMFLSMRPVKYNWKEVYGGSIDVGFIAEEVADDFPPLATIKPKHEILPDGTIVRDSLGRAIVDSTLLEPYSVKYGRLPVYLFMLAKQQDSAITALTNRLDELQLMLETCCAQPAYRMAEPPTETQNAQKSEGSEFVLLQNDPNPFSDYTDIRVSVPESAKNVSLLIVDMKGVVMLNTPISGTSETVRVYSSDIGKGIFTYYLLSEGNVIASRKMVSSK